MMSKLHKTTKQFGLKVKIERIKKNFSQEQLAEMANLNRVTISTIERGLSVPSIEVAARIAEALGVELHKMFVFED